MRARQTELTPLKAANVIDTRTWLSILFGEDARHPYDGGVSGYRSLNHIGEDIYN